MIIELPLTKEKAREINAYFLSLPEEDKWTEFEKIEIKRDERFKINEYDQRFLDKIKFHCEGYKDKKKEKSLTEEEIKDKLKENYEIIKEVLKKFLDLREDYYDIITLWIIGTWFHKQFETYPYLYFNATKGSGKSRALKIIKRLVPNGKQVNNVSESVLFRTAYTSSFCIDEFEFMSNKEKSSLLLLLNSAYKKGTKVERMSKVKKLGEEKYEVEEFEVYTPIAIANIWGIDNTLEDRCISLTLEKSNNKKIVKLIEDFEHNSQLSHAYANFLHINGSYGSLGVIKNIQSNWNNFIINNSLNSYNTYNTHNSHNSQEQLFVKIDNSEISGRDLELFMPLFIIADFLGISEKIIKIAEELTGERKDKDLDDNIDVQLIDYISRREKNLEFLSTSTICIGFRNFMELSERQSAFINNKWTGKALKRLGLIKEKKKSGSMKVILDIEKAKDMISSYRGEDNFNTAEGRIKENDKHELC